MSEAVGRIKPDPGVTAAVLRERARRINIYNPAQAADLATIARDAADVIEQLMAHYVAASPPQGPQEPTP